MHVFHLHLQALKDKQVSEFDVRSNVQPLFETRMLLGEFDPPELNPYNKLGSETIQSTQHQELAIKAAIKSFVLLKNDNSLLPLKNKLSNIAVSRILFLINSTL